MTFLYDALSFFLWRSEVSAFALVAHASHAMSPKDLRWAGDFLLALAEVREAKKCS